MKRWIPLGVVVALVFLGTVVSRADGAEPKRGENARASVSSDLLAQMGLSGMRPVSDQEGMRVRGKGLTFYSANLASVYNVNFAGVYIFQRTRVYSSSGMSSSTKVTLP
ncbi:MAG: hypothetical protein J5I93_08975 [Pirellulaceae bacterium]|nr:hypothetical protein [Pirellulaceae bacterium]